MSDFMTDHLTELVDNLSQEIETVEQTWLDIRRMKGDPRYLARADKLERALDLMRAVKTELLFEFYDKPQPRKRAEREK